MPKKTSDYKPEAEEKEALRLAEKLSKMVQCEYELANISKIAEWEEQKASQGN